MGSTDVVSTRAPTARCRCSATPLKYCESDLMTGPNPRKPGIRTMFMTAPFLSPSRLGLLPDQVRGPLGRPGDRHRGVRAGGSRQHRAVGHVQPRMAEDLAAVVDDSLRRVAPHRAAAQRMYRDQRAQDPPVERHPEATTLDLGEAPV